jgi:hypothetical protein
MENAYISNTNHIPVTAMLIVESIWVSAAQQQLLLHEVQEYVSHLRYVIPVTQRHGRTHRWV